MMMMMTVTIVILFQHVSIAVQRKRRMHLITFQNTINTKWSFQYLCPQTDCVGGQNIMILIKLWSCAIMKVAFTLHYVGWSHLSLSEQSCIYPKLSESALLVTWAMAPRVRNIYSQIDIAVAIVFAGFAQLSLRSYYVVY